jgi:hypothetical protein
MLVSLREELSELSIFIIGLVKDNHRTIVVCLVCFSVAVLTTLFRLYIRRGRLWWDDAFSLLSMIFLLVHVIGVVLHVQDDSECYICCL